MNLFGQAIKARMKQLKLSQQTLADAIGIRQSALSQMLNGKQPIDAKTFSRLCRAVGITCDQAAWLLEL